MIRRPHNFDSGKGSFLRRCQIAPKCDPLFASKNDPSEGAETGGAEPREHFIKGKTIREISRDLKVSRNTVRRVLRS
jgi:DNA-binding NarL/FixJ family response regulator